MADSKLITAIGEELECPVCAEYFTDARFLSCMHTFCLGCLSKCDKTYGRGGKASMHCPLCRKVTYLAKNGVAGLQIDFTSNKLVTRLVESINNRNHSAGSSGNSSMTCQSCQEGTISAYCLSHCHFICATCHSLHGKLVAMRTHEVVSLKDLRKGNVTIVRNEMKQFCSIHKLDTVCFCYSCMRYLCDLCCMLDDHECSNPDHGPNGRAPPTTRKRDAIQNAVQRLVQVVDSMASRKRKVKRLRAMVKRKYGSLRDKLKSSHDLRLSLVTRTLKGKYDDVLQQLNEDETIVMAKIASVDETLGHTESRAREAKVVGDNALEDGQHAEIAFVQEYLESTNASINEDKSPERQLRVIEQFSTKVDLAFDSTDSMETCASFGNISYPEVWQLLTSCHLPCSETEVRAVHYDSCGKTFLVAGISAIHSVDVGGSVELQTSLPEHHAVRDMTLTSDAALSFLLCQDKCVHIYDVKSQKHTRSMPIPRSAADSVISCLAVKNDGVVFLGDQSNQTVVQLSSSAAKVVSTQPISPLQMIVNDNGVLVVVCRTISNVGDDDGADSWNRAGVSVRILDVGQTPENAIRQDNWQAAAVAAKKGSGVDSGGGRFFALGVYVLDDGKQLASLAEYDRFGIQKEMMLQDIELPLDLNNGGRPFLATDTTNSEIAICAGNEVRIYGKRRFSLDSE